MADMKVIKLRLPVDLNSGLSVASRETGVSKNKIFNEAVTAAVDNSSCEAQVKAQHVYTCVRLPDELYASIRNVAYGKHLSLNAMFVKALTDHLGEEPCHVVEDVSQ